MFAKKNHNGTKDLDAAKVAYPCGVMARSIFNGDLFLDRLFRPAKTQLRWKRGVDCDHHRQRSGLAARRGQEVQESAGQQEGRPVDRRGER